MSENKDEVRPTLPTIRYLDLQCLWLAHRARKCRPDKDFFPIFLCNGFGNSSSSTSTEQRHHNMFLNKLAALIDIRFVCLMCQYWALRRNCKFLNIHRKCYNFSHLMDIWVRCCIITRYNTKMNFNSRNLILEDGNISHSQSEFANVIYLKFSETGCSQHVLNSGHLNQINFRKPDD